MKKIIELPFDLYSRNYIVKTIVNNFFRKGKKNLNILDLGGYAGNTEHFFKDDNVTILDVHDIKNRKNYIKGDATDLIFKNNHFDIVTSFDVFEHIPRTLRIKFIQESFRVAKKAVILAFPVNNNKKTTSEAEVTLNAFFNNLTGREHPWLKEHIAYGIPTIDEFEKDLKDLGISYQKIFSNNIELWKMMQVINFIGTTDEIEQEKASIMNKLYNNNIESIENNVKNGYRAIYVLFKDNKDLQLINKIEDLFDNSANGSILSEEEIQKQTFDVILDQFMGIIERCRDGNKHKEETIRLLQKEIFDLQNSTSWKITLPIRKSKKILRDILSKDGE